MKLQTYITITIIICTVIAGCSQRECPQQIEIALEKAGSNRNELEQAWKHFAGRDDSLKLRAVEFLIENMDIHYTKTYYWETSDGKKIDFSEFDHPDFKSAVAAINILREKHNDLHFKDTVLYDIHEMKGKYLIEHVNRSVDSWRSSLYKNIPFKDFCEYILPYRVTIEPISHWLPIYQERYKWVGDSLKRRSMPDVFDYLTVDFKEWFTFTYGEVRNEPSSRLSAQQLLFREKGECEDIAALETFILRSQSIPTAYVSIPCWGTSFGAHFANTVFDRDMRPSRFDVTRSSETDYGLEREPAKVLRYTYSRQPQTLAEQNLSVEIPEGYLRQSNYIDITSEYWQTADVTIPLHSGMDSTKVVYAGTFNQGAWNSVWWGQCDNDSVTFKDMPRGLVILPLRFQQGELSSAGYPMINGYNHRLHLIPDLKHRRAVTIKEQEHYLRFRPNRTYELYYWDNNWVSVGKKRAQANEDQLEFSNVPQNALLLLIPDYSERKERPFIIMPDGTRYWF